MTEPTTPRQFERVTCSRCFGNGMYGPKHIDGGRCFKCGGKGALLTKRGAAANALATQLLSIRADEVRPGDRIYIEPSMFTRAGWGDVETAEAEGETVTFKIAQLQYAQTYGADRPIRIAMTPEVKAEALAIAFAFEDTLTKNGTPRKGKGARAA